MKLKITVHGVAYEVEVEVLDAGDGFHAGSPLAPLPKLQSAPTPLPATRPLQPMSVAQTPASASGSSSGSIVASPLAGNIIEIKCKAGDSVAQDQVLLLIEAMKMETAIAAPAPGKIRSVDVAAGDAVREGQVLIRFE